MTTNLFKNLKRAARKSYLTLEPFRSAARNMVQEYVGPGYGDQSYRDQDEDRPFNLINQMIDGYMMLLAANRPQVTIRTHYPELKAFAKHFEVATNNLIKEIELEHTIRQWVMDAFFSVGIIKVHLADSGLVQMETDWEMDPGSPFASNVSIDDFVFDTSAKKWSEVRWAGDMYRIPYEDFEEGIRIGLYNESAKAHRPSSKTPTGDIERQDAISRGNETDDDELEPMIDLADIWVPREGKVYTFAMKDRSTFEIAMEPVAEMEWDGPEHGPYHLLGFNDVPNNIMPVPPLLHMDALSRTVNNLLRKNIRDAEAQRNVNVYAAGASDDASRVKKAGSGAWVQVNDMESLGVHSMPGPDQGNLAFMHSLVDMFDRAAGNLPAILGLGQQADTLGQEQLIHGANSRKEGQMQYRVVDGVRRVVRSLAYELWIDEFKEMAGEYSIPGSEYVVQSAWKPGDREGNFLDYNFDIVPFSMTYQPPAAKVESANALISNVYAPMLQVIQSQGGTINFKALNEFYADALDLHILRDIIQFSTPPEDQGTPQTSTKPAVTTRNYNRRSSGGGTYQGQNKARQLALLGAANNGQQQSAGMNNTAA